MSFPANVGYSNSFIGMLPVETTYSGPGKVYLVHPVEVANTELEGVGGNFIPDTTRLIPVMWLGPEAPSGPFAVNPVGDRWVAAASQKSAHQSCGDFGVPADTLSLEWVYQLPNQSETTHVFELVETEQPNRFITDSVAWSFDPSRNDSFELICENSIYKIVRTHIWFAAQGGAASYEVIYPLSTSTTATEDPFIIEWVVTDPSQYTIEFGPNAGQFGTIVNYDKRLTITNP